MEHDKREQRNVGQGLQVPPTSKVTSQDMERIRNASAGLRMPGSNVTVDRTVKEKQEEEARRTRMEVERRKREAREQQFQRNRETERDMRPDMKEDGIEYEEDIRRMNKDRNGVSKKEIAWKKKMKRLWLILAGELIALALLMIGCAANYVNSKMNEININDLDENDLYMNEGLSAITKEKFTTIALFGLDSRDVTSDAGNRSDCIIIANINNETKEVKLVSIYRDTYLEVTDRDGSYDGVYTKVTHAYSYGGPKAAIDTLNKNLDLQITEYATVNFASLTDAINDLGGVTVNVDESERQSINTWLPETAQIAGMSYTPLYETGDVVLDGLQATTYCRIRNLGMGDIDRAGRQREVLSAMLDKAKTSDIATLNRVIDDILPEISTSLTKKELLGLLSSIFEYEIAEGDGFPFVYKLTTIDNMSVEVPADLETNVILLHQYLFNATIKTNATTDDLDDYSTTDPAGDTGATSEASTSDEELIYEPSSEVIRISDQIRNYTGIYPPEDPEFRGAF